MKTAPKNFGKANWSRAILLVALSIALGITGCQKEDELQPSGTSTTATTETADRAIGTSDATNTFNHALNISAANVSEIVRITHHAGLSDLPDYSVVVRSDGWVVYDGRVNVRIQERIAFRITDQVLYDLHRIFLDNSFNLIVPDFRITADMPHVTTTYRSDQFSRPRTIYDNYKDDPERLIFIRESAERLLGIEKYVSETWQSPVLDPSTN